tara:strand:- start:488 stop:811 length:324 start_codon:yes stop_codon:yes gene_type:complete
MGAAEILGLEPIVVGDFSVEAQKFQASYKGKNLRLTKSEFIILYCLLRKKGFVVSRNALLDAVSGGASIVDRNIDVHIYALRKKIGCRRHLIKTVRSLGYRLDDGVS